MGLINLNNISKQENSIIKKFLKHNGSEKFDENDISSLKKILPFLSAENKLDFNVSYNIVRFDKEFDLIKIGNNRIINIELKKNDLDVEQCKENYEIFSSYYGDHEIYVFCYVSDNNKLYLYNPLEFKLEESDFDLLNEKISLVKEAIELNINISISSIYSNPDFFLSNKYRLSKSQLLTKQKILNNNEKIITIVTGRAGTGKTLLALDLYNHYTNLGLNVVYITPFKSTRVISSKLFEIINIKTYQALRLESKKYDIAISDESQRISSFDVKLLNELIINKAVLFGDINQNIDGEPTFERLCQEREEYEVYNMNQIIRSDDTFDLYARKILNMPTAGIKNRKCSKNKIDIEMYDERSLINNNDFLFLEPAKSLYFDDCTDKCTNKKCHVISKNCIGRNVPYHVIGNEYDKVILFLCDGYGVKDGKLVDNKKVCTRDLQKQLYSLITRSVSKLKIITDDIIIYNFLFEKREEL